jgi:hypothetical protein
VVRRTPSVEFATIARRFEKSGAALNCDGSRFDRAELDSSALALSGTDAASTRSRGNDLRGDVVLSKSVSVLWASKYIAAPFILAGIVLTVATRSGSAVSAVEMPHLQPTENTC